VKQKKKSIIQKPSKPKITIKLTRIKTKIKNKLEDNYNYFLSNGGIEKKNQFNKITKKIKRDGTKLKKVINHKLRLMDEIENK
jgi:hypothetical protein